MMSASSGYASDRMRFLIPCFFLLSLAGNAQQKGMEQIAHFGSNPGNLEMFLFVPENFSGPAPLVVMLHGCAETAKACAKLTGWNELATEHQFMVLYPQ